MNWFLFKKQQQQSLEKLYDSGEAGSLIQILAEELLPHYDKFQLKDSSFELNKNDINTLNKGIARLKSGEPLQYILEKAWFYNMELTVNHSVLIPRPETEELVHWIIQDWKNKPASILDVGTGSGCISLSLANNLCGSKIKAIDVSEDALQLAQMMSCELGLAVQFQSLNILDSAEWNELGMFDVIVSNPPYITVQEKEDIHENVLKHEPHLALFVENDDSLIFYRAISKFALTHLHPGGCLYFECNEHNAEEVLALLDKLNFSNLELKTDLQGKNRMVKGVLPLEK